MLWLAQTAKTHKKSLRKVCIQQSSSQSNILAFSILHHFQASHLESRRVVFLGLDKMSEKENLVAI